jgi:hypothetical protein
MNGRDGILNELLQREIEERRSEELRWKALYAVEDSDAVNKISVKNHNDKRPLNQQSSCQS